MDMRAEKPRSHAQVKCRIRARHLRPRAEQAYVGWILRDIGYHGTIRLIALLLYGAGLRLPEWFRLGSELLPEMPRGDRRPSHTFRGA